MNFETLQTHPDFKSVDSNVTNANTLGEILCEALQNQHNFEKRTTPVEMQSWNSYEALQQFTIDLEKVDRLYHVYYYNDETSLRFFHMIARMEYNNNNNNNNNQGYIFVELQANCDFTGFDCQGGGVIFISENANLFMRLVLGETFMDEEFNKCLIYDFLKEDDDYDYDAITVERETCDKFSRMFLNRVPMLKYICHEIIYKNKDQLWEYKVLLPEILKNSVDDFINTKEAIASYNE